MTSLPKGRRFAIIQDPDVDNDYGTKNAQQYAIYLNALQKEKISEMYLTSL